MVLLILFTSEVVTVILRPRTLLTLHVVVGLTLVPPLRSHGIDGQLGESKVRPELSTRALAFVRGKRQWFVLP
jgi:hypothetical protein